MLRRRVVVSGLGVVSPIGIGKSAFWASVKAGRSGVGPMTRLALSDHPCRIAAEVKDFAVTDYILEKEVRRMDAFNHYAIAAAKLALEDAAFEITDDNADRVGLCIGTAIGGIRFGELQYDGFLQGGLREASPYTAVAVFLCGSLGFVSIEMGIKGWSNLITACGSSGTDAIGYGFNVIRGGGADVVLAAGTEAPLTYSLFNTFCRTGAMARSPAGCVPFDRRRSGFVLGEGCGLLVLEDLDHALARRARIYAEVLGYGRANGPYETDRLTIDRESARDAVIAAIDDAKAMPRDIHYIHASSAGEVDNDRVEATVIRDVWGGAEVPVSSIKGMVGQTLGAAGGFQGVANALALSEGFVPPNGGVAEADPDPALGLPFIPARGMARPLRSAIQLSFGYTGASSALVMGAWRG